jgi:hypothetical protein
MLIFADENIKSFTMEEQKTTDLTTEELSKAQRTIAVVLAEIQEEGHSKIMPFDIGGVEIRMLRYAAINGITLGSDRLYMSAKQGSCRIHITEIHKNINRPRCIASQSVITRMKPSGKVELLIISIRNPYSHATVPHIVALLGSTFHAAKIRTLFETCKDFRLFFADGGKKRRFSRCRGIRR